LTTGLRRARPGNLGGDLWDTVAELVEWQVLEDDVDQIPERRRGVGRDVLRISRSGSWSSVPR
jgi:hypothetical protein